MSVRPQRDVDGKKTHTEILDQEIEEGLAELNRSASGLFLSSLSAGLDLGFSVLVIVGILHVAKPELSPVVLELLLAGAYSIGFILVIIGRSELFTEHTTVAVLPVLARRATVAQLGRLWGIVYAGNLLGAASFALMFVVIGPGLGIADDGAFAEIGHRLLRFSSGVVLASAILAGWLMGLLSWLVAAARETISKVFFISLITGVIGFGHLHHSIVGSIEVLVAVFAGMAAPAEFLRFLLLATLGNAIGGTVFVGLLKYAHASRS